MLARANRLSLRENRFRLEKEGLTRHSPLFICLTAASPLGPSAPPRFAVLISKKLALLSVDRHRLKRLITEVIRHNLAKFPLGTDFLLIPKKPALTANQSEILTDLSKLCS